MSQTLPGSSDPPKPPELEKPPEPPEPGQPSSGSPSIPPWRVILVLMILGVCVTVAALGQSLWALAVVMAAAAVLLAVIGFGRRGD